MIKEKINSNFIPKQKKGIINDEKRAFLVIRIQKKIERGRGKNEREHEVLGEEKINRIGCKAIDLGQRKIGLT